MKKAILLAAHGSNNRAANSALNNILKLAKAEYPDIPIKSAFTSYHVRKIMREQGQPIPSVEEILKSMHDDGITHVVIQSLHVIPGIEFHHITRILNKIAKGEIHFEKAVFGQPLLSDDQAVDEVSDLILSLLPDRDPEKDALILVAHGSRHSGNIFYHKFKLVLEDKDKHSFLGAVSSPNDIVEITEKIKKAGLKRAFLLPLLFGAGNHVQKDMAGEDENSWKNIVAAGGIEPIPAIKGIGEFGIFADRWMDNLRDAIKKLDN
ncbi:sirohydrochlorin cobaltochelatase [Maridesulfovibrio ferrireducens]|uniref:Sirohydrochlorin cobaltochelatase n=1 Tax=Maridesulfovibrio ferrireducens TaxID=246191 RepID=A0A1G9JBF1_9BACT|nr:sirohydrochlorin cobaltochelatase [Maridesulfovibrio ferrireducens]SDL34860.1 sirohydrochlorin cobaltochelatase [Maridesulfovibrio ferrireducens]